MEQITDKIYHGPAGHGSMKTTYEDAKKKDQSITYGDIQAWFKKRTLKEKLNSRDTIALKQTRQKKNIRWIFSS